VHDFIDEWVSAPYEPCRKDSVIILAGLDRLSEDAQTRFGEALSELSGDRVEPLCRALADMGEVLGPDVKQDTEHTTTTGFFSRFRKLVTIGYFTTPVGMQDLGYVGNRPLISYDGPPAEALRKAGVKL